jgi:RNA polymerase I-specific transcription initiation factor RRN7
MYKLPYLEAVRLLPESMVLHLTKHNKQALSPNVKHRLGSCYAMLIMRQHGPSTLTMHSLASRLAKKIYAKFGVYTPELNGSNMLWRITKDMGGTRKLVNFFLLRRS